MGGAEMLLVNWLNLCERAPAHFKFELLIVGQKAGLLPMIHNSNIVVHHFAASRLNYLSKLPDVVKLVFELKPHIIHSHLFKANILARFLKVFYVSAKVVNHYHGLSLWMTKSKLWLDRSTQFLLDKAIVVSDKSYQLRLAREGMDTEKIELLYNFYNGEINDYNNKAGGDTLTLGMACRLVSLKNIPFVIDLVEFLLGKGFSCRLLIAGDGPEFDSLRNIVINRGLNGHVLFLGFKEDLREFYRTVDYYVIASDTEDLPMSMVEAMAYGCRILSSDIGGIKEVLNGGDGLIVPRVTKDYFKGILKYIEESDIKIRSKSNNEIVVRSFLPEQYLDRTLSLYEQLIDK